VLEQKYPRFSGLNLSWEVREGLVKHNTSFDHPAAHLTFAGPSPSLEAQVANLADEITYYSHDLDDGLTSGLLTEKQLHRDVSLWRQAANLVRRQYGALDDERRRYFIIRVIIDQQVKDVVFATEKRLAAAHIQTAEDIRQERKPLARYSAERRKLNREVRQYLYDRLYFNPQVFEPNRRAVRMLEELFRHFLERPDRIGDQSRKRIRREGLHRVVCDYLAGMTDRYAILEYQRWFGLRV
jgi:dGTPase